MNVIFIGQSLLENIEYVNYGGMIRKYYSQKVISETGKIIFVNKFIDLFKLKRYILNKDYYLWVHYPLQRKLSIMTIFLAFFFRNRSVLIVHDIPILQKKDLDGTNYSLIKLISIKIIENLLFRLSKFIVLPVPKFEGYIKKRKKQVLFVMPPGISQQEIRITSNNNHQKRKNIATYFGSMKRGDSLSLLSDFFTNMDSWELHLIGPLDDAGIHFANNIKYYGQVNHAAILDMLCDSDVILIPYPKKEYFNLSMPIKLGYSLISLKPIITTKLDGIQQYINYVGLNQNVIYVDKWDETSLKAALNESLKRKIDKQETINNMSLMTWEKRLRELIELISDKENHNYSKTKWV